MEIDMSYLLSSIPGLTKLPVPFQNEDEDGKVPTFSTSEDEIANFKAAVQLLECAERILEEKTAPETAEAGGSSASGEQQEQEVDEEEYCDDDYGDGSTILPSGIGYGSGMRRSAEKERLRLLTQQTCDKRLSFVFRNLLSLLSSAKIHQESFFAIFSRSKLLHSITQSLSGESLITVLDQRSEMYSSLFEFLNFAANSQIFLPMFSKGVCEKDVIALGPILEGAQQLDLSTLIPTAVDQPIEPAEPSTATISNALKPLATASQKFLTSTETKGAKAILEFKEEEIGGDVLDQYAVEQGYQDGIKLANQIVTVWELVMTQIEDDKGSSRNTSVRSDDNLEIMEGGAQSPPTEGSESEKQPALSFESAASPLQFSTRPALTNYFCPTIDSTPSSDGYHYDYHSRKASAIVHPKKRAMKIHQEMTLLSDSLPLSSDAAIFVRVHEDRYDLMQALVTGPKDTPYENGLFLFDVFLPEAFPNDPPMMKFMTTGHGTVRFNPNLYSDGKICLSLLGTWSGEQWDPTQSTLFQALLSVQAMILGAAEPFYNEPGYECSANEGSSRRYNFGVRSQTVQWAMLDVMRNPPAGFEEVVKLWFTHKKDEILQQVSKWAQEFSEHEASGAAIQRQDLGEYGPAIVQISPEEVEKEILGLSL